MAKHFKNFGPVESISMHLQITPIYYIENIEMKDVKASTERTEISVKEKGRVNMRRNVTLEHCF